MAGEACQGRLTPQRGRSTLALASDRPRCAGRVRLGIFLLDVSGHGLGAALLSFTPAHLLSPTIEGSLLAIDRTG